MSQSPGRHGESSAQARLGTSAKVGQVARLSESRDLPSMHLDACSYADEDGRDYMDRPSDCLAASNIWKSAASRKSLLGTL